MTAVPRPRWWAFALPKDGHSLEEYEDAFAVKRGRCAIADGASESSFAAEWARLLVEGFISSREDPLRLAWLNPLRQRWADQVDALELEWFGEEKRRQGAFATFLGVIFKKPQPGNEGPWKAIALGDSCLFQVRQDRLIAAFPVSRSGDFSIRPAMLGSRGVRDQDAFSQARFQTGAWQSGDRFFVMTDALAEWFLRRHERLRRPWRALARGLAAPTGVLKRFVEQLRSDNQIRNDDVTLLMIALKS
jgi:hypothetical protein